MQLIVAEKPSVARDLARVLGVRPVGRSYFEGSRCVITWCIGHLVELEEPAAYDGRWKAWRLDSLPMLPAHFQLRPSKHATEQLRVVARLLGERRFTSVVNACDAGREGELIFRYVYQYAGGGPPVQRLWISSLTDDAIRRGFAGLRPGVQLDPLGDAARSRSEADWLVGMNATRGVTVRGRESGHDALYSIGRVQTPTLAMLVEREQAIRTFVPRDYWEIRGDFTTAAGERFSAMWRRVAPVRSPTHTDRTARSAAGPSEAVARTAGASSIEGDTTRLGSLALARAIVARDAEHGAATAPLGPRVERLRAHTVREPPPLLFDLTSLQRTANRRFGWSASRTLELAQALYERHKLVTYPRTDARHLTSDVARELPRMFSALADVPDYAAFAGELLARPPRLNRRVVDDAKVHDHHAIVPTGNAVRLAALDRDEQRLFDLIARRFLGAFFPDAEFAVTEAWIRVLAPDGGPPPFPGEARAGGWHERAHATADATRSQRDVATDAEPPIHDALPPPPDRYLARGRVRTVAGWQAVAGIEGTSAARRSGAEADDRDQAVLPVLVEGQPLDGAFATVAKQTRPPPRYTEATLLSAMESAGKVIDDEALREAMKDCGLGTPATRAAIIETLLRRAYIVRDKQQLVPTAMGIGLIAALPVASLASPELTGAWEARLARVARGEETRAAFMADITRYVADLVDAIRTASPPPPPAAGAPAQAQPHGRRWQASRRRRAPTDPAAHRPRRGKSVRANGAAAPRPATSDRRRSSDTAARWAGPDDRRRPSDTAARRAGPDDRRRPSDTAARPAGPDDRRRPSDTAARRAGPDDRRRPSNTAARRAGPDDRRFSSEPDVQWAGPDDRRLSSEPDVQWAGTGDRRPSSDTDVGRAGSDDRRESTPPRRTTPTAAPQVGTTDRSEPGSSTRLVVEMLGCPRCRAGTLMTGARGWGCSRWREGCRFVIWFETSGRRLTLAQLRDLVVRGRTRKARFGDQTGSLVLDGDAPRFEPADEPSTPRRRSARGRGSIPPAPRTPER